MFSVILRLRSIQPLFFAQRTPQSSQKFKFKLSSSVNNPDPNPSSSSSSSSRDPTVVSILRFIPDWADSIKEQGMRRRRELYNHDKWLGVLAVLRASSLPYQLTAPALALLLVFRTEASYSRYEEGRKAWMRVIAGTDDIARQLIAGVKSSSDATFRNALLNYIIAFPVALKAFPRSNNELDATKLNKEFPQMLSIKESLIKYVFQANQKTAKA